MADGFDRLTEHFTSDCTLAQPIADTILSQPLLLVGMATSSLTRFDQKMVRRLAKPTT